MRDDVNELVRQAKANDKLTGPSLDRLRSLDFSPYILSCYEELKQEDKQLIAEVAVKDRKVAEVLNKLGLAGKKEIDTAITPSSSEAKGKSPLVNEKEITSKQIILESTAVTPTNLVSPVVSTSVPVGNSDYKDIIESGFHYVDKTEFIKHLIDNSNAQIKLFIRPRRFGKTLNMSMLEWFFNKTDIDTSYLFQNSKIWQLENGKYRLHQGKYPVIFLTFKDINGINFNNAYERFQVILAEKYREYEKIFPINDRDDYLEIIKKTGKQAAYERSLINLASRLYAHYQEKPIVLIDEYDTPIHASYNHGYYDDMIDFMKSFLGSALKDARYIKWAVLTGILRVSKESLVSGFNNPVVYSLLNDGIYNETFGFTDDEVKTLLHNCLPMHSKDLSKIEDWYGGYRAGVGATRLYNPWSIMNIINKSTASALSYDKYWTGGTESGMVKQILEQLRSKRQDIFDDFMNDLYSIIMGREVVKEIDEHIVFSQISESEKGIWNFLVLSGYLSAVKMEHSATNTYKMIIPNSEIRDFFKENYGQWLDSFGVKFANYKEYLTKDDTESKKQALEWLKEKRWLDEETEQLLLGCLSYPDKEVREKTITILTQFNKESAPFVIEKHIAHLSHTGEGVRQTAIFAIKQLRKVDSPEVQQALINNLSHSEANVRSDAVALLREDERHKQDYVLLVITANTTHVDKGVRETALDTLMELERLDISRLLLLLNNENDNIKETAIDYILKFINIKKITASEQTIKEVLLKSLTNPKREVREKASSALLILMEKEVPILVGSHLMHLKNEDAGVREDAVRAMQRSGFLKLCSDELRIKIINNLLEFANDVEVSVRRVVIKGLGKFQKSTDLNNPRITSCLMEKLEDVDVYVGRYAANALNELILASKDNEELKSSLLKQHIRHLSHEQVAVRQNAIDALRQLKTILEAHGELLGVRVRLCDLLKDSETEVRNNALAALKELGQLQSEEVKQACLKNIRSTDEGVIQTNLVLLKEIYISIPISQIVETFVVALKHNLPRVVVDVFGVLQQIIPNKQEESADGFNPLVPSIAQKLSNSDITIRKAALALLVKLGKDTGPFIIEAYTNNLIHPHEIVVLEAIDFFKKNIIIDRNIIQNLANNLKSMNESIRKASFETLEVVGKGQDELVVNACIEMLKESNPLLRKNGLVLLGNININTEKVINALLGTLNDPHPDVRQQTLLSIEKLGILQNESIIVGYIKNLHQTNLKIINETLLFLEKISINIRQLRSSIQQAVIEELKGMAKHTDTEIKRSAREILEKFYPNQYKEILTNSETKSKTINIIGSLLEATNVSDQEQLLESLKDSSFDGKEVIQLLNQKFEENPAWRQLILRVAANLLSQDNLMLSILFKGLDETSNDLNFEVICLLKNIFKQETNSELEMETLWLNRVWEQVIEKLIPLAEKLSVELTNVLEYPAQALDEILSCQSIRGNQNYRLLNGICDLFNQGIESSHPEITQKVQQALNVLEESIPQQIILNHIKNLQKGDVKIRQRAAKILGMLGSSQSIVIDDLINSRLFAEALTKIKPLAAATPTSCYISYGWGVKDHEQFAVRLAEHLIRAGIHVYFDHTDKCSIGQHITYFTEKIWQVDYVILIGSKILKRKYDKGKKLYERLETERATGKYVKQLTEKENISYVVNQELDKISASMHKKPGSLLALLLDGEEEECLPPLYWGVHVLLDAQEYRKEKAYCKYVFKLLASLLRVHKDFIDQKGRELESSFSKAKAQLRTEGIQKLKASPQSPRKAIEDLEATHTFKANTTFRRSPGDTTSFHPQTNKAYQHFIDAEGEQDQRQYEVWYSEKSIAYLLHSTAKTVPTSFLPYVFINQATPNCSFSEQFKELIVLRNLIRQDICFVATEPSSVHLPHFICGVLTAHTLLVINPIGLSKHHDCNQAWEEIHERHQLAVYLSINTLQKESGGLISCGPICVELALHLLSQVKEEWTNLLKNLIKSGKGKERADSWLHRVDISPLLPPMLQGISQLPEGNYQQRLIQIRAAHGDRLIAISSTLSREVSENTFWDHCENAEIQIVMNQLCIEKKTIIEVQDTSAFQRLAGRSASRLTNKVESTLFPLTPQSEAVPAGISCQYTYSPSISRTDIVIEIEQGATIPLEWNRLLTEKLMANRFSLSHLNEQESVLFKSLISSAPSLNIDRPIAVNTLLENCSVKVKFLRPKVPVSDTLIKKLLKKAKVYKNSPELKPHILLEWYGFILGLSRGIEEETLKIIIHKKIASAIKHFILEDMRAVNDIELKNLAANFNGYRTQLENIRLEAEELFNPHQYRDFLSQVEQQFRELVDDMLDYAQRILGQPPCAYTLLCVGSLATHMVTPYSDVEYLILVDKQVDKTYFRNLRDLFELFMIGFGESSIGDTTKDKIKMALTEEEYHHCVSTFKKGTRLDEHKKPQELNHLYELINTPEELLRLQSERGKIIYQQGNHLTSALLTTTYLGKKPSMKSLYENRYVPLFEQCLQTRDFYQCLFKLSKQAIADCKQLEAALKNLRLRKTHLEKEQQPIYELKEILEHPLHLARLLALFLKASGEDILLQANFFDTIESLKYNFLQENYTTWLELVEKLLPKRLELQIESRSAEARVTLAQLHALYPLNELCLALNSIARRVETILNDRSELKLFHSAEDVLKKAGSLKIVQASTSGSLVLEKDNLESIKGSLGASTPAVSGPASLIGASPNSIAEDIILDLNKLLEKSGIQDEVLKQELTKIINEVNRRIPRLNYLLRHENFAVFRKNKEVLVTFIKQQKAVLARGNYDTDDKNGLSNFFEEIEKVLYHHSPPLATESEEERKSHMILEKALFDEQERVEKDTALIQSLQSLKLPYLTRSVYIMYAWPVEQFKLRETRLQEAFIPLLVKHLGYAHISAIWDKGDNFAGNDLLQFMARLRECDYVLVLGTESLRYKLLNNQSALRFEQEMMALKWAYDVDRGYISDHQTTILPYVITGIRETAFLDEWNRTTSREWRKGGYISTLLDLIAQLYGVDKYILYNDFLKRKAMKITKHQVLDIEELINEWAKESAKEAKSKVTINLGYKKRVTKKSKIPHQELSVIAEPIKYERSPQRIEQESKLAARRRETFVNSTETNKKFRLKLNTRAIERRTHTFTFGLNLGLFVSATTPYGGGGYGVDFSSTKTKEEQSVEKEMELELKGKHEALYSGELWIVPELDTFTMDITLKGDVPLHFNHKVKDEGGKFKKSLTGHKLQFVPINEIFQSLQQAQKLPKDLSIKIEGDKVVCTLKGEYRIDRYDSRIVVEKERPLDPTAIVPVAAQSNKTWGRAYEYKYAPQVKAVGMDFESNALELKEFSGEQFTQIINIVLAPADDLPEGILKLVRETFLKVDEDRSDPNQYLDRPISVDYREKFVGKNATRASLMNKEASTRISSLKQLCFHTLWRNNLRQLPEAHKGQRVPWELEKEYENYRP